VATTSVVAPRQDRAASDSAAAAKKMTDKKFQRFAEFKARAKEKAKSVAKSGASVAEGIKNRSPTPVRKVSLKPRVEVQTYPSSAPANTVPQTTWQATKFANAKAKAKPQDVNRQMPWQKKR
jgi:hypothetical protein